jgi:glycosyltransferase involved in cell wall biosynthesis
MPSRILILTNGHLCRNPRVVKEASTLGRAGYEVRVLHVKTSSEFEALDADLTKSAPFQRDAIDLRPHAGAAPFARRLRHWLAREACARWGLASAGSLGPAGSLWRRARAWPADLTIVHNEVAHAVGLRLQRSGRRVAADIEDWHSEDLLPADRARRPLALLRRNERELLLRCVHTTTTSHALSDGLFARYGGRRPEVITNSFPLQSLARPRSASKPPRLFWFSQTIGPGRGLEEFFASWQLCRQPSEVVLLGAIAPGYEAALLGSLPADRRAGVHLRPLVPPAALPDVIAEHDLGLALEQSFIVNRDLTITNKILQYLNAGLAIVASNTAGQREVLAAAPPAGRIVSLDQPALFAATLDAMLANRDALATSRRAARRLAEDIYCWEREEPRLLALVARALTDRT